MRKAFHAPSSVLTLHWAQGLRVSSLDLCVCAGHSAGSTGSRVYSPHEVDRTLGLYWGYIGIMENKMETI